MSGTGVESSGAESVEVIGTARRRRFTESYKRRIVSEASRAGHGEIGLMLRREGLYSSQLAKWREGRDGMMSTCGERSESTKMSRGTTRDLQTENQRLEKENAQLKLKLRKAEAMLELQKKAAEIVNAMRAISGSDS